MCLGCEPFEERHTGEALSRFFEKITEAAGIRHKVRQGFSNPMVLSKLQTEHSQGGTNGHLIIGLKSLMTKLGSD